MSIPSLKARISFQAKVLIPVILVMVLLIAATMWLVNRSITAQLQGEAMHQLDTAGNVFTHTQVILSENLLSRYRNMMKEPRVKAVVTKTDRQDTAALKTVNGLLDELLREDGEAKVAGAAKVAIFTAENGNRFGSANLHPTLQLSEFERSSGSVIRQALGGQPSVETVKVGGTFFDVVSIPVEGAGGSVGAITFGVEVGSVMAQQVKQLTSSDIVLLADGQVIASSFANAELNRELGSKFAGVVTSKEVGNGQIKNVTLNGERFLCKAGHFGGSDVNGKLDYLLLSSHEKAMGALHSTQQTLLWVSLVGIFFSTLIVWIAVSKVTQPLRHLRASAEAVGRGDFSKRVEVTSKDECGELAAVFNQMIENVKTSREKLEKTVETLKATQNQLVQSEKLSGIGEFVAGVAHELNNPLTSVMGFAELLQQTDIPEQNRKFLDMIFKSAKRCQKIVASLLSFARKHQPERKVISVNTVVESAIEIVDYQLRTNNIELITDLDSNVPATSLDPHQMQQVFINLISNARQAMEGRQKRGCIRIRTEAVYGRVRITFGDNGPGITPENMKKLFVPFFTTKEVGKGTGLGLSLCYGIVTEHGGTITPQSKVGEGATFIVELPITQDVVPAKTEPIKPLVPVQNNKEGLGKRVLVVDDEDSILQMIREVLSINGYQVDIAHDGESALEFMAKNRYDLALCDWKMPGLNGQEVDERLRVDNPEMSRRLIFITGDVVNEKTQEYLRKREKICLSKPFTLTEFRSAITQVLSSN